MSNVYIGFINVIFKIHAYLINLEGHIYNYTCRLGKKDIQLIFIITENSNSAKIIYCDSLITRFINFKGYFR